VPPEQQEQHQQQLQEAHAAAEEARQHHQEAEAAAAGCQTELQEARAATKDAQRQQQEAQAAADQCQAFLKEARMAADDFKTQLQEIDAQREPEKVPADGSGLLCGGIDAVPSVEQALAGSDEALLRSLEEELAPYRDGFTLTQLRATAAAVGAGNEEDAEAQRGPRVWLEVGRRQPPPAAWVAHAIPAPLLR
jgi:hypothetical protein